jgi:ureidoglycolate lyase
MTEKLTIEVEELTAEAFAPYGRVVEMPESPATGSGPGWRSWFPVAEVLASQPVGIGLVRTEKRDLVVAEMERHVDNEELLIPLWADLIQPMGVPEKLDDPDATPSLDKIRAFRIRPGQAIIMKKGAWHSCAYPVGEDTTYCFVCVNKPAVPGQSGGPWIPLAKPVAVTL